MGVQENIEVGQAINMAVNIRTSFIDSSEEAYGLNRDDILNDLKELVPKCLEIIKSSKSDLLELQIAKKDVPIKPKRVIS